ncbi:hypothetical protein AD931_02615 [Gluconobacter oxydans]|uniref:Uncharacterized protein n=2 Tax=Gluconobacter oxydans TaxID=442 RepID=A0AB34XNX4_GLUOY|nr:hypothetical protein [Gluconobacter oxydans]AHK70088.1 hypothetical protein GLS_c01600 [Gluconobacter oxydans DSM 3504]KXV09776.1 hypothetical protein AD931_02615 [Gluconobacter oxydans]
MKEIIQGRRLGTSEQVKFEYDPTRGNSYGVPSADCESNLVSHHERIAPEAEVIIAPPTSHASGVHSHGRCTLFYSSVGTYAQSTLFHELWHYAENYTLTPDDRETVYAECRSQGDTWESPYLDSDCERAARAFQHYAAARASGLQLTPARRGTAQHVFERLYEGTEHAALMKRRRQERWEPVMSWVRPLAALAAMAGVFIGIPHFLF